MRYKTAIKPKRKQFYFRFGLSRMQNETHQQAALGSRRQKLAVIYRLQLTPAFAY